MREVDELVLLVGGNPMPNYITAMFLKPKRVHLLYTTGDDSTRPVADRLAEALQADTPGPQVNYGALCSKSNPQAIMADYTRARIPATAHLNVTGGTKAMAVFVHQAWFKQTSGGGGCSYLDGSRDMLVDSCGGEYPIKGLSLTIDRITQLHGVQASQIGYRSNQPPTDLDALAMLDVALGLVEDIRTVNREVGQRATSRPYVRGREHRSLVRPFAFVQSEIGVSLRLTRTGLALTDAADVVDDWAKFLTGQWLEQVTAHFLTASGYAGWSEFSVEGIQPGNRPFEVDVIAARDHHTLVVSCSTRKEQEVKPKIFEVAIRGPQVGGALARTAFVCLLEDDRTSELCKDFAAVWGDGSTTTRIFGLSHLREWRSGNYESLKDWAM